VTGYAGVLDWLQETNQYKSGKAFLVDFFGGFPGYFFFFISFDFGFLQSPQDSSSHPYSQHVCPNAKSRFSRLQVAKLVGIARM
jgi:hypothetical protein